MPPDILSDLLHPKARALLRPAIVTPARIQRHAEPIFFDADRFRWYFREREGLSLQAWRDRIDAEMKADLREKAQHPAPG